MITPRPPSRLLVWLHRAIRLCFVLTLATLVYGHLGGEASGLNPRNNYITEYLKQAPHWPWLVVSSFSFALLLTLLALAFLLRSGPSFLRQLGCLLLAASSMATFFAAYAPVRQVEQPPTAHHWRTPAWWFTSKTARSPYELGMADAYSDVHYRATRLVVVTGVSGILLLSASLLRQPGSRVFAWTSLAAVLAMSVLFQLGDKLEFQRGLWQRLGFILMAGWIWAAHRQCQRLNTPEPHRKT